VPVLNNTENTMDDDCNNLDETILLIHNEGDKSIEIDDITNESFNEDGDVKEYKSCDNTLVCTEFDRMGTRPIPTRFYDMIGTVKSLLQNEYSLHVRNNGLLPLEQ